MSEPNAQPPTVFGFRVEIDQEGGWAVSLPHQCDRWDIAGESDPFFVGGVPHAEAVAELRQFVAEANAALTALYAEQTYEAVAKDDE
jgi:hypothetical protein